MSDYWVVESSRCRIIEMSDQWDVGLTSDHWSDISPIRQLSDYRDVGLTECRTNELTRVNIAIQNFSSFGFICAYLWYHRGSDLKKGLCIGH